MFTSNVNAFQAVLLMKTSLCTYASSGWRVKGYMNNHFKCPDVLHHFALSHISPGSYLRKFKRGGYYALTLRKMSAVLPRSRVYESSLFISASAIVTIDCHGHSGLYFTFIIISLKSLYLYNWEIKKDKFHPAHLSSTLSILYLHGLRLTLSRLLSSDYRCFVIWCCVWTTDSPRKAWDIIALHIIMHQGCIWWVLLFSN